MAHPADAHIENWSRKQAAVEAAKRCPNVKPGYTWANRCSCERCVAGRAENVRRNREREQAKAKNPILSTCPRVTRGRTYALGCSCDVCLPRKSAVRARARLTHVEQYVDEIAVDIVLCGEKMRLNRAERIEVARQMFARPAPPTCRQVAERLGVTMRTVERYKAELLSRRPGV